MKVGDVVTKGRRVKPEHYIDPKRFIALIVKMKESPDNKSWEELGKMFLKLSKRILMSPNFINYTYERKDDMLSEAVLDMCRHWRRFDVNRENANAFAYFSQIAFNAYKQELKDQKKRDSILVLHNGLGLDNPRLEETDE